MTATVPPRRALIWLPLLAAVAASGRSEPAAAETRDRLKHRYYGEWCSSRLGGGGYWLDTHASVVPDRWYVWSDVGGLYRSDDDARTWRALHQGLPDGQGDTTNVRDFYEH
ncbi:MAG: hypothetical protein AAF805_13355, partial [Planctomycetota bacterium]